MKAVNLVSGASRRAGGGSSGLRLPAYAFVGFLAGVLLLVTMTVLASNTIAARKAQISQLQAEVSSKQAVASQLGNYAQFAAVARSRVATVRSIAATRFDWHSVLSQLARVVPANTSLLSLTATVAPGATAGQGAGGGSSAGGLRSAISNPAFELTGCATNQDDVARLMSRLRVIEGVTRVTLGSSVKAEDGGSTGGTTGCTSNQAAFDVVVFFSPLAGAGPTGAGQGVPG